MRSETLWRSAGNTHDYYYKGVKRACVWRGQQWGQVDDLWMVSIHFNLRPCRFATSEEAMRYAEVVVAMKE